MNKYRITRINFGTVSNHVYESMDMQGLIGGYFYADQGDILKIELIGTTDEDMDNTTPIPKH